jgi:hypothetical protein
MEESILNSTKKKLNIAIEDTSFDIDIIDYVNTAFSHLQQLGVGPEAGFQIVDAEAKWEDFLGADARLPIVNAVKTNISMRVRLLFDPPQIQSLLSALERQIEQSDWRINVLREETDWVDPDPPVLEEV